MDQKEMRPTALLIFLEGTAQADGFYAASVDICVPIAQRLTKFNAP
jgi:hypothetical protein